MGRLTLSGEMVRSGFVDACIFDQRLESRANWFESLGGPGRPSAPVSGFLRFLGGHSCEGLVFASSCNICAQPLPSSPHKRAGVSLSVRVCFGFRAVLYSTSEPCHFSELFQL